MINIELRLNPGFSKYSSAVSEILHYTGQRMNRVLKLASASLYVLALLLATVRAETPVALELVLAVDASSSVNYAEHGLQMRGIAHAFRSPEVMSLIEHSGGVAVTLVQWSSRANLERTVPWRLLKDQAGILAFAAEVESAGRVSVGSLTAIGTAIEASLRLLDSNGFYGQRQKIDISGDGHNNTGLPLLVARNLARARGVTINGLAIQTDVPNLARYYREHIITGPDAFVIPAADYDDVARAMRAKLLRELAPAVSRSSGTTRLSLR